MGIKEVMAKVDIISNKNMGTREAMVNREDMEDNNTILTDFDHFITVYAYIIYLFNFV